jgi:hypothetical protein
VGAGCGKTQHPVSPSATVRRGRRGESSPHSRARAWAACADAPVRVPPSVVRRPTAPMRRTTWRWRTTTGRTRARTRALAPRPRPTTRACTRTCGFETHVHRAHSHALRISRFLFNSARCFGAFLACWIPLVLAVMTTNHSPFIDPAGDRDGIPMVWEIPHHIPAQRSAASHMLAICRKSGVRWVVCCIVLLLQVLL